MTKTNLTPILAIICMVSLLILSYYTISDLPAFGDPDSPANRYIDLGVYLEGEDIKDELNRGIVPRKINDEMGRKGFPELSGVNKVKHGEWDGYIIKGEKNYEKEEKYYHIEEKNGKLEFYRYAPVERYKEKSVEETEVFNIVTSILIDYRGFDTLFETVVIFTAGIAVILLLRRE